MNPLVDAVDPKHKVNFSYEGVGIGPLHRDANLEVKGDASGSKPGGVKPLTTRPSLIYLKYIGGILQSFSGVSVCRGRRYAGVNGYAHKVTRVTR